MSSISLTVTKEAKDPDHSLPLGNVIGVRLVSNISTYEASTKQVDGASELTFRANLYQVIHKICWVSNADHDHVRILYKPSEKGKNYRFVKSDNFEKLSVPKRVFWIEKDCEGIEIALRSISIYKDDFGVSGLAFSFAHDVVHCMGKLTEDVSTLDLDEGESLNRFDIEYNYAHHIITLLFWTTKGRQLEARHLKNNETHDSVYPDSTQVQCSVSEDQASFAIHDFDSKVEKFFGIIGEEVGQGGPLKALYPIIAKDSDPVGIA